MQSVTRRSLAGVLNEVASARCARVRCARSLVETALSTPVHGAIVVRSVASFSTKSSAAFVDNLSRADLESAVEASMVSKVRLCKHVFNTMQINYIPN